MTTEFVTKPLMEDLLLSFNSSMAPDQENENICDPTFNEVWNYQSFLQKEMADAQDDLLDMTLQSWGMAKPSLYYYYQHDATNQFGIL